MAKKSTGVRRSLYMPEEMVNQVESIARRERRSFNQQVALYVEQGVSVEQKKRAEGRAA